MPPDAALPVRHALVLGALHGPAELLPISSSAHVTLVPWLAGWPYATLDAAGRKTFEVALHAGTLAGMLVALRRDLWRDAQPRLVALAALPAAVAGLAFERPIEQRLGTPAAIAAGLAAGALALAAADALGATARGRRDARTADACALGLAQAAALVPGMSRTGMTLAAARARGFRRDAAYALSRQVAVPVLAGATALKALRAVRDGLAPGLGAPVAAGALAAAVSTLAAAPLARHSAIGPWVAYRLALAAAVHGAGRR